MPSNKRIPTLTSMREVQAGVITRGRWDVIVPEETTNLMTNPSFEIDTAGFGSLGGVSLSRVTTDAAFGGACMDVNTASSGTGMSVNTTITGITTNTIYTLSFYYKKTTPQDMKGRVIVDYYSGGSLQSTITIDLPAGNVMEWTRFVLTTNSPAICNQVVITPISLAGQPTGRAFNMKIDGIQFEQKAYATTYCDGTQGGCVWNGVANVSQSYRNNRTRKGGRIVNFKEFNWQTAAVVGLGMATVTPIAVPYAQIGGAVYQRTVAPARTFQIGGGWDCDSDIDLHRNRLAMINALSPFGQPQAPDPLRLIFTPARGECEVDTLNTPHATSTYIDAAYSGGLEGAWVNDVGTERTTLVFTTYLPFAAVGSSPFDRYASLTLSQSISPIGNFIGRSKLDGSWNTYSGAANGVVDNVVIDTDGNQIMVGRFTTAGGLGIGSGHIAKWNGASWAAIGAGFSADAHDAVITPNGTLYAVQQDSFVQETVWRWTGATWTGFGTITHATDAFIEDMISDRSGNLYIGGIWSALGGSGAIQNMAKWNGSTWSAMPGGNPNGRVLCFAIAPDGTIYVGGEFTSIGGISASKIARFNPLTNVWQPLGDAPTGTIPSVTGLLFSRDGNLYANGGFTTIGGVPVNYVAKWNGAGWSAMGDARIQNVIRAPLWEDESNGIVMAGTFYNASGGTYNGTKRWTGATWITGPMQLSGISGNFLDHAASGYMDFVGGSFTSATAPAVNAITATTQTNDVTLTFVGPGTLVSIRNYATGDELFFDIDLAASETLTVRCNDIVSATSNIRGDLASAIIPSSNAVRFRLVPGVNNIALLMTGTTGASSATMKWHEMPLSLDANR